MKKINVVFIGECIIIILLLLILGILLKDGRKTLAQDSAAVEGETIEITEDTSRGVGMEMENDSLEAAEKSVSEVLSVSTDQAEQEQPLSLSLDGMEILNNMKDKKIVVFGDSIWNAARGADGISEYVEAVTGATVYNCAIGGTTAALVDGENNIENWSSDSFNGMIYAARKLIPAEQAIQDEEVLEVIKQVDLSEVDYVIVAYGLNDFFSDVSIYPTTFYEITNYVGALRNGINKLRENYPNIQVILVSPTYTSLFEGEKALEIGDYVEAARGVADTMKVPFLDMFHILGDSPETRASHLGDGVHMSAEGRKLYAKAVINFLQQLELQQ